MVCEERMDGKIRPPRGKNIPILPLYILDDLVSTLNREKWKHLFGKGNRADQYQGVQSEEILWMLEECDFRRRVHPFPQSRGPSKAARGLRLCRGALTFEVLVDTGHVVDDTGALSSRFGHFSSSNWKLALWSPTGKEWLTELVETTTVASDTEEEDERV